MVRWHKRARVGVGLFGLAFAIVVYAAIGERQTVAPVPRPARFDPRAILESTGAAFQQFQEARKDYVVDAERQLTYEGGATKFLGVTINVTNRGGRDFVISGQEAQAGEGQKELAITGAVTLTASDGFTVTADQATFSEVDATVRVDGPVSFRKGRMAGSGIGMIYNQNTDVLSLANEAHVIVTDESAAPVMEFTAGTATFARQEHYLALDGNVHALRQEQVLDAERSVARLSDKDEHITFIELRGNARVSGGGAFDSMSARDIDLDYTEDGATLEKVAVKGGGGILLRGDEGTSGRQFLGESLDLTFAPDATLIGVTGRGNVRVDLPGPAGTPGRSVKAQAFDAEGPAGTGLTAGRFSDAVEYREEPRPGRPVRMGHSSALSLTLAENLVTSAVFTGRVRFEDQALQASAGRAEYDPAKGLLRLSGADAGGGPRVADAQIQIEATSIAVTLDGPRMTASGTVKTVLQPRAAPRGPARVGGAPDGGRLPGLLQEGNAVNVNANLLEYQGPAGTAVYSGNAALWQGETAVRGNVLTLDRARGDLIAAGDARSNMVFDTGVSIGRGPEIRYDDATRRLTYGLSTPPGAAGAPPGPGATAAAQLSSPQGELSAGRIDVTLARTTMRAERLDAFRGVSILLDKRVGTGDRLTYYADEERYVMTGIATVPVKIVEECRETSGRTVTFFKSTDRVIVDGNEEVRTQSSRAGSCPQPVPR